MYAKSFVNFYIQQHTAAINLTSNVKIKDEINYSNTNGPEKWFLKISLIGNRSAINIIISVLKELKGNLALRFYLHCLTKVKVQPTLLFSSFVHNASIKEVKNMKLSEYICYEMIN